MTMKYNERPWGGLAHHKAANPLETFEGSEHFSAAVQSSEGYQDLLSSSQLSLNLKLYLCEVHPSKYPLSLRRKD